MYTTISDFITDWETESAITRKMLQALNDASLDQRVSSEGRTLGRIAWHITGSIGEMLGRTGLPVDGLPSEHEPVPSSASDIVDAYARAAAAVGPAILGQWTDDTLSEECDMYGEMWKHAFTLSVLIVHQIHHRGQMTVLMRQAGLPVPGAYGPSRDEWAQYGLEPQA